MKYTLVKEIYVVDPDSGGDVHIELWKDNNSGGIFGIDTSFLEQVDEFYNPFNGECEKTSDSLPL